MRKQNETNKPKKKQSLQQPKRSCRKIVKLHKKKEKKMVPLTDQTRM